MKKELLFPFIKYLLNKNSNLPKNLSNNFLLLPNLKSSALSEIPLLDIFSPEKLSIKLILKTAID